MKNMTLILIFLLSAFVSNAQRATVHITTKLPITYRVSIDDQIQYYEDVSNLRIMNVSGAKKLSLFINTPSAQTPSVSLTNSKDQYYTIEKEGDRYVIVPLTDLTSAKKMRYTVANYIGKPKLVKLDSGYKQVHSCKLDDAQLNQLIQDIVSLNDANARKNYLLARLNKNCLQTHQIKSIGFRLEDDALKLDIYKKFFNTSLDRINYKNLLETFKTQIYANQFYEWLEKSPL